MNAHALSSLTVVRWLLFSVAISFTAIPSLRALTIHGYDPAAAAPGQPVRIGVGGLAPSATYNVTIDGQSAAITSRETSALTVTVPEDAETGPLEIREVSGDASVRSFFPFRVLAQASVVLGPEVSPPPGSLRVATAFGEVPFVDGMAIVQVLAGQATPVFAVGDAPGTVLLGVVTDPDQPMVLGSRSTARALLFLTGLLFTTDEETAAERLAQIDSLSALDQAEAILASNYAAGIDPAEDPALSAALAEALVELIDVLNTDVSAAADFAGQSISSGDRVFDFTQESPRDLEPAQAFRIYDALDSHREELSVGPDGIPIRFVRFAPPVRNGITRANSLDWMANVYALDPAQFQFGKLEVDTEWADYASVYHRLQMRPLHRMLIPAPGGVADAIIKPVTPAGLLGQLEDFIVKALVPSNDPLNRDKLPIPLDEPGIYLIRTYSGSFFAPQNELVRSIPDGVDEKIRMLTLNLQALLLDGSTLVAAGMDLGSGSQIASHPIFGATQQVQKELARLEATGELRPEDLSLYARELARAVAKKVVSTGTGKVLGTAGGMALTIQGAMLTAAGMDDRLHGLIAGSEPNSLRALQTIESTIVMVGDPFAPKIDAFWPRQGHRGTQVRLRGDNFSSDPSENVVTFGYGGTSPDSPPISARAEVLDASLNELVVRVPEEAATGIITVHVEDRGTTSTADWPPPGNVFTVVPDPVIVGIDPPDARAGDTVRILGENFGNEIRDLRITFVTSSVSESTPDLAAPNQLLATLPFNAGSATVQVTLRHAGADASNDRLSNVFEFEIQERADPVPGATIQVTSTADNNARDGEITLREALMLANGTLAYSQLTTPPEPRPDGVRYETDHLTGTVVGSAARNRIERGFSGDVTIAVQAPLPTVASWTSLDLGATFLFSGPDPILSGGGTVSLGLSLDGTRESSISGMSFTGFQSAAVSLSGGARGNAISVAVDGGGGDGIRIESSSYNSVSADVRNVDGDGCHLIGPGTAGNTLFLMPGGILDNGGWGIHLEDGVVLTDISAREPDSPSGFPGSGPIQGNAAGGVRIAGATSYGNFVGVPTDWFGGSFNIPAPPELIGNDGPGLLIEAPGTRVWRIDVRGNAGDGIRISGPSTTDSQLVGCRIGFDPEDGSPQPNQGNGITLEHGVRRIRLGGRFRDEINGGRPPLNLIGGNQESGIFMNQVSGVEINATRIGRVPVAGADEPVTVANGQSGIVLLNSRDCRIGSELLRTETYFIGDFPLTYSWYPLRVEVAGHLNGTGVRLIGAGSTGNIIAGTFIGCEATDDSRNPRSVDLGNKIGVEILDGAYGNVIGLPGYRLTKSNYIKYNREAGIRINSGGDPTTSIPPNDVPYHLTGGNRIRRNEISAQHGVGILLEEGARVNVIGGRHLQEMNVIDHNESHGVHFDGVTASRRELSNRLIGNVISDNGGNLDSVGDPLTEEPAGVGVLLTNSQNQIIGGDRPGEGNWIWNNWSGVLIDDSAGVILTGNEIGGVREEIHWNRLAGVVIRDGEDNQVGPGNSILGNGREGFSPRLGGIAITGNQGHRVIANWIGATRDGMTTAANYQGILLDNAAGNTIGGAGVAEGNIIVGSEQDGIVIRGTRSTGNFVGGNSIGFIPDAMLGSRGQPVGVGRHGILIEDGASGNRIGEVEVIISGNRFLMPAENRIYHSGEDGIRIEDMASLGNSLLYNSVTANTGLGIRTFAGGNKELSPPVITALSAGYAIGTVDVDVPSGSLVQIYSDSADEGESYESQGRVVDGAFEIFIGIPFGREITATVTDLDGNTSEFGNRVDFAALAGVELERVAPPGSRIGPAGATNVVALLLRAKATNTPVQVKSLRLAASGDPAAIAAVAALRLFQDVDGDGIVSEADRLLGEAQGLGVNWPVTLELTGARLDTLAAQRWLLALDFDASAPDGATLTLSLLQSSDVVAAALMPLNLPATTVSAFPLHSDEVHVSEGAVTSLSPLVIQRTPQGEVELLWHGDGMLQWATQLRGPWTDLPDATSPHAVILDAPRKFYRLFRDE